MRLHPCYPLDGEPHIYQPFKLDKDHPWEHVGVDWDVVPNTPTRVILDGRVRDTVEDSPVWGRFISVMHADGCVSVYAHLNKILVHRNEFVSGGTVIGLSGGAKGADGAGQSTGWHLHLEVRTAGHLDSARYNVDPIKYIESYMEKEG